MNSPNSHHKLGTLDLHSSQAPREGDRARARSYSVRLRIIRIWACFMVIPTWRDVDPCASLQWQLGRDGVGSCDTKGGNLAERAVASMTECRKRHREGSSQRVPTRLFQARWAKRFGQYVCVTADDSRTNRIRVTTDHSFWRRIPWIRSMHWTAFRSALFHPVVLAQVVAHHW
jgi:hypothetical protein